MKRSNRILHLCLISFITIFASCKHEPSQTMKGIKPVDLVYPLLDTENSRWFLFSSACRPFGMVNLSPDTQQGGAWGSGYRYKTDTVKGLSHIHAWQMSGLSLMPVTIDKKQEEEIFTDYYSPFQHENEIVAPGFHHLVLERYQIGVELTSTDRVGFHKFSFPKDKKAAVLFNRNTMLGPCMNVDGTLQLLNSTTIQGKLTDAPTMRRPKPLDVFFYVQLSSDVEKLVQDDKTGNYLILFKDNTEEVLLKAALSYTSNDNAKANMQAELPHWDFDKVVRESKDVWNNILSRITVEGGTETQQRRFYTDLWHALQGRRIISDVNGAYPDNTGDNFRIGQIPLNEDGQPEFNHYNSDSFWGAQWTINTLWGLVYPEIMEEFCHSLLQYYKDGGLVPRGPSGGNYTYVMTGASSTPFIVSAIQKGILKADLEDVYQALRKNHMPGGIMEKAGYEHKTNIGGGFKYYYNHGYVPWPTPEGSFGLHQDGASLTMEYAYQDWTLAQLAKRLGKEDDYQYFLGRSQNYRNVFNTQTGWMQPKNREGKWKEDYDPYEYEHGFIESNGAQSTWFVPHDLPGLAELMGGEEAAVEKLNTQFETARKLGFTSGTSHDKETHPEYIRIPINYGNQPSMQTAHIFQYLGRPDLTQKWVGEVIDSAYSGISPAVGYFGDEDQGLMGSLAVLMKIGLFQMNGGTEENPEYQITAPIFDKVTIKLHPDYYTGESFEIVTVGSSHSKGLIKSVKFNDEPIDSYSIQHNNIVNGGRLEINLTRNMN